MMCCAKLEEEAVDYFTTVSGFREFAETKPAADVGVSGKWCCLTAERLKADNGTRVTAIDSSQHALFGQTAEDLSDLTPVKRKPYILQVTVWDGKKKGDMRSPRMAFRRGALYAFRQLDGMSFYADVPTGRTQFDADSDKIVEVLPPSIIKRKAGKSPGKKRSKVKTQEANSSQCTVEDYEEEDVSMEAETKSENPVIAVRTRGNGAIGA